MTRCFSADKVCTMETGIYRFSKKERTKSQVTNITRLSPCFTLFASPEPSKCKFVLKMHNVRNDFARKCHLKSQTSKNSKINLFIYSHSKKVTCSKLIKSCKADTKTGTKMSPGNGGLTALCTFSVAKFKTLKETSQKIDFLAPNFVDSKLLFGEEFQ